MVGKLFDGENLSVVLPVTFIDSYGEPVSTQLVYRPNNPILWLSKQKQEKILLAYWNKQGYKDWIAHWKRA